MSLFPYMYDFDKPRRMMERESFRTNDFFGYSLWEKLMKPMEQMSAAMNRLPLNEIGNISSDKETFQVNVDVQHFAPEEIKVKVMDGHVVVQGKHEEKQDEHGYISREFVRRYALPKGCLPDTVESKLSSDGVLTVTAPTVLALPSTGERIVPITHTGPVQKQLGAPDSAEGTALQQTGCSTVVFYRQQVLLDWLDSSRNLISFYVLKKITKLILRSYFKSKWVVPRC